MNDQLQTIGPDDPMFKGLPVAFRTLYQQVQTEQWRIWREASSPRPASDKLMKQINAVSWAAWQTELGQQIEKFNPYLPAEFMSLLANHQHYDGMLGTDDLIPTL